MLELLNFLFLDAWAHPSCLLWVGLTTQSSERSALDGPICELKLLCAPWSEWSWISLGSTAFWEHVHWGCWNKWLKTAARIVNRRCLLRLLLGLLDTGWNRKVIWNLSIATQEMAGKQFWIHCPRCDVYYTKPFSNQVHIKLQFPLQCLIQKVKK